MLELSSAMLPAPSPHDTVSKLLLA